MAVTITLPRISIACIVVIVLSAFPGTGGAQDSRETDQLALLEAALKLALEDGDLESRELVINAELPSPAELERGAADGAVVRRLATRMQAPLRERATLLDCAERPCVLPSVMFLLTGMRVQISESKVRVDISGLATYRPADRGEGHHANVRMWIFEAEKRDGRWMLELTGRGWG